MKSAPKKVLHLVSLNCVFHVNYNPAIHNAAESLESTTVVPSNSPIDQSLSESSEATGYACFTIPVMEACHPAKPPRRLEVSVCACVIGYAFALPITSLLRNCPMLQCSLKRCF